MTTEEWARLSARMVAWWPATQWSREQIAVWYEDLAPYEAGAVAVALERLKQEPSRFGPSIGEVLSALREQESPPAPPWAEAWKAIRVGLGYLHREGDGAVIRTLTEVHPAVAAFAANHGLERLSMEPTEDPDIGGAVLRRLAMSYEEITRRWSEGEKERAAIHSAARRAELGSGPRVPRRLSEALTEVLPAGPEELPRPSDSGSKS